MLERRTTHRRRVCLEAKLTAGMHSAIETVRVRNVTHLGAEIVAPSGRIDALPLQIRMRDSIRQARIVWRRMDRFGLEFVADDFTAAEAEAPERLADAAMPAALKRRLETIVSRAGRSA